MNILLTGAAGQLGRAMVRALGQVHRVDALTRAELDITDDAAVLACVGARRPDVIINCAAYNHVDRAEDEPDAALAVNAFGVRALARAAGETGSTLVHYSTDFVFDGTATTPYREDDPTGPRGVYAASKLLGEWFAADARRWYVLRVESLFGGSDGPSSARSNLDRIVEAILAGHEMPVFIDRVVSPSYVDDVVRATERLVGCGAPGGLYHCVNTGLATWHEIAQEVARRLRRDSRLVPIRMADLPLKAARPRFCALSNAKLAALGIAMPTWQDAVDRHLSSRQSSVVSRRSGQSTADS